MSHKAKTICYQGFSRKFAAPGLKNKQPAYLTHHRISSVWHLHSITYTGASKPLLISSINSILFITYSYLSSERIFSGILPCALQTQLIKIKKQSKM